MAEWIDLSKKKPQRGEQCLILEQGYGVFGNHYWHIDIAYYDKDPVDKRKNTFLETTAYELENRNPWSYRKVTHWIPILESLECGVPLLTPEELYEKHGRSR